MKISGKSKNKVVLITLAVLMLIVTTGCSKAIEKKQIKSPELEFIDTKALEFSVEDINGNVVDNSIFLSYEITMINFWSYDCDPCTKEMPEIDKIYDKYKSENINVIGIAFNSEESNVEALLEKLEVNYMNIRFDEDNKLLNEAISEFDFVPFTLFVDKEGKYIDKVVVGSKTFEEFDNIIKELKAK